MTAHDVPDDRLRMAFQSLSDGWDEECPPALLEQIWKAAAGDLSRDELAAVLDAVAEHPAAAEAWRIAFALRAETSADQPASRAAHPTGRWLPSYLAAAAVVLVGVTVALIRTGDAPPASDYRSAAGYVIESTVADDTVVPPRALWLRWTPGPEGARYHVRVTTEDLRVVASQGDLDAPEYLVPNDALREVPPGARLLWQVEAELPDGGTVASQTFAVRLQ